MKQQELSQLTDQELLAEAKKMKSTAMMNAVFIGFLIGIIIFSIFKNTVGLVTLIPLYFVYRLVKSSKNDIPLEEKLKARNLS